MNLLTLEVPTQTEFNNKVQEIFKRPEYNNLAKRLKDLYETVKEKVVNYIINLLSKSLGASNARSVSGKLWIIFFIIAVAIFAGIIAFVFFKINKSISKDKRVKNILGETIDAKTTVQSLRETSLDYLNKHNYKLAVRFEFISLLLFLHENNVIYLEESKTNEEILLYLKTINFESVPYFHTLVDIFNQTFYGNKACGEDTFFKFKGYSDNILKEVALHEEKGR